MKMRRWIAVLVLTFVFVSYSSDNINSRYIENNDAPKTLNKDILDDPILINPPEDCITTCVDEEIWINLSDCAPIDTTAIVLRVNDDIYTLSDCELIFFQDTLLFRPGPLEFETGLVRFCLDPLPGSFSDTICWQFYVDSENPLITNFEPSINPSIDDTGFVISFDITDLMLPIDSSTIHVEIINNDNSDTNDVYYSDAFISWANPTFSFPAAMTEVTFDYEESVLVRIRVRDLPPVTCYCSANLLDTTICIVIADSGSGIKESIPSSFSLSTYPNPFNSAVTISAPEGAEVEVFDVNGRKIVESPLAPLNKGGAECNEVGGSFTWTPDETVGSGVYLVRARFEGGETATKRVVYLK